MSDNKYENLYPIDSGVPELILSDFNIIKKNLKLKDNIFNKKKGLILFYTPWCSHCKNMVDSWTELTNYFKNTFPLAVVNCENLRQQNDLCCSFAKIYKYPTIKYVTKNGKLKKYDGLLTKDDILYFICGKC